MKSIEILRSEMAKQKAPGVAVAIVSEGQVLSAKGYGLANVEHDVAVTEHTIFQSGSVGKQFTATAVMLLVEDGKIGLEDSITKYFPGAPASLATDHRTPSAHAHVRYPRLPPNLRLSA